MNKTTFLAAVLQPDGSTALQEVTYKEWRQIVDANKELPEHERRYFIVDTICDGANRDRLIMEVSKQDYREWGSQARAQHRNYACKKLYQHISLDELPYETASVSAASFEQEILGTLFLAELRDALADWEPWATDILNLYLCGKRKEIIRFLMEKYSIGNSTARRYHKEFKTFIKLFANR